MTVDEAVEVLERTPATLGALLGGLSEGWVQVDEGPETFSPLDVLGHLIHGEEMDWIPRVRIILEHGEAQPFTPFDRFAFRETCKGLGAEQLLKRFGSLRRRNLETLRAWALSAADLERAGTHPALGRVTLGQLLASWVVHDLGHLKQVVRTMAGRYRQAVGPWREYLSILDRP